MRSRAPIPSLARIGTSLIVDALLAVVPGVGNPPDTAHRANHRNYALLEKAVPEKPDAGPPTAGYTMVAGALVTVLWSWVW